MPQSSRILSLSDISLLPRDHYEVGDNGEFTLFSFNWVIVGFLKFVRCFGCTQLSYGVVAVLLCVISFKYIFPAIFTFTGSFAVKLFFICA